MVASRERQPAAEAQRDALVERLFGALVQTFDVGGVYLGTRLGLYRALADGGAATSVELASRAGINERYAREWLEQQAVTGIVEVDGARAEAESRRYSLPEGHREVLLDQDSQSYLAGMLQLAVSAFRPMDRLLEAYRTGGGVDWTDYGLDAVKGQGGANRPLLVHVLPKEWLPAMPDVHARLQAGGRVADIGCGEGWASIGIALAYPTARVDGYDPDEASIQEARKNAEEAGVADRVAFHAVDAATAAGDRPYDLVLACEMVHDLSRPVPVLATMRALAGAHGTVLVVDERVEEEFTAPGSELERVFYGWSTLVCLPSAMVDSPSAATGTVMRPATLRTYAREAGFQDVEVLPIENDFFRVYRLM